MQIDLTLDQALLGATRRRARRTPWIQLLSSLLELSGHQAELVRHGERTWASVTFSGTRHTVVLTFIGAEAVVAGEALIDLLPDHEFAIPGQLVADAAVVRVDHSALPQPRLEVELEILMLDEV